MTLSQHLNALMARAFIAAGLDPTFAQVLPSQRPELGQFQCNGCLAAAKAAKANPKALAEKVLEALKQEPSLARLSLAGPGFINLSLADEALAFMANAQAADARLGLPVAPAGKVVIDFGGPNVAKPMHVGHLRSAIIGDCLQRLHRRLGAEVVSDIHLGDWGTQMGMLIEAVREEQPGLPHFINGAQGPFAGPVPVSLADLERLYPAMSARCKADEALAEKARLATRDLQSGRPGYRALWKHFVDVSVEALKADFGRLGVRFDLWYGESRYQDAIPAMLETFKAQGLAVPSEGALVVHLEAPGTETPPLLLVKSDGGYLYATTDLATLKERISDGARRVIYVTDKRQSLHFRQVFSVAHKAGWDQGLRLDHVEFGTVNGKDGKPFKTREGGVMRLKDLLDMAVKEAGAQMEKGGVAAEFTPEEKAQVARQVGLAAVKFADLSNHRLSDYVFDLERFSQFEGKTGPYHLYAAVRMKAILRKAAERGFAPGPIQAPALEAERAVLLAVAGLPDACLAAAEHGTPHFICEWAWSLAQAFSSFYQATNILREEDPARRAGWLGLTALALKALEDSLQVLGLETPDRM